MRRHCLADVANEFRTSSYPDGEKVRLASFLLKDGAQDWWDEFGRSVGDTGVGSMAWDDFVSRFRVNFSLVIEVR